MTHISREELERWWRDGAEEDRARIVQHLAVCDACVKLYREVVDERPLDEGAAPVAPEIVAAGRAAYGRGAAAAGRTIPFRRSRWAVPLTAAATLLLGAGIYTLLRSPAPLVSPVDPTVRSTSIQPLSPAGPVAAPFVFEWASPLAGAAYEVAVYDVDGRTLWSMRTERSRTDAPPELLSRLTPGVEYAWDVTAFDSNGVSTIRSPRQRFVSPRAP
jgi:hypothetical protein